MRRHLPRDVTETVFQKAPHMTDFMGFQATKIAVREAHGWALYAYVERPA
ncbi:hypothetical protein Nocox_13945 [Nonomuraea coxensis DSM 45129]|uniref:Uncharacterized protein n=1 Tax=Nonomuraea coxensis DSM 45129 TaxID=1122611 RepID=A0ABX8TY43_9ACTN|nr:hypothetical protein Nocox_13945 [Nonomuraea coxensis DSM 45129]